jgi:hypothetical protein
MKTSKNLKKLPKPEAKLKNKGGRPKINIDLNLLAKLGNAGCTAIECAAYIGCSTQTITNHLQSKYHISFLEFIKEKDAQGRALLKLAQFQAAIKDKPIMQIWQGKNRLGQSDIQQPNIHEPVIIRIEGTNHFADAD